jgi:hypothetical protein
MGDALLAAVYSKYKYILFQNIWQHLKGHSHEKVCGVIPLNDSLGPNYITAIFF